MVKANFYSETNLAERASAGGLAKQEAPALPRYVTCSYVDFLRVLVRTHGEDYLRTPDGEALAGVPDAAFVLPPVKQKPATAAPPLPVSSVPAEAPKRKARGVPAAFVRTAVAAALTGQPPMSVQEIEKATGLRRSQVKVCLSQYRGTYFRHVGRQWEVINNAMG